MRPLPRAPWAPERMDDPDLDRDTLIGTYRRLDAVNRWLGGVGPVWRALRRLPADGTLRVIDIGAGAGGLALALWRRATRQRRPAHIVATDLNAGPLAIAQNTPLDLTAADALRLPFAKGSFDAAILSLTLHHLPDNRQAAALREAGRVAHWVLVTDLERSRLAYAGARFLAATAWRGDACCRVDGPVSVMRGYTRNELRELARTAGLRDPRVTRARFHRLLLVARGDGTMP